MYDRSILFLRILYQLIDSIVRVCCALTFFCNLLFHLNNNKFIIVKLCRLLIHWLAIFIHYKFVFLFWFTQLHTENIDVNWASEASPTLGCSIKISRDLCRYVCLSWSKKRRRKYVGQTRACSKSVLGSKIRPVTPVLLISTIRYSSFSMDGRETFTYKWET